MRASRWSRAIRVLPVLLVALGTGEAQRQACAAGARATGLPTTAAEPASTSVPEAASALTAIAFLEARIARDPDDVVAANMLADRYLQRLSDGGGDADLERARFLVAHSLAVVPARLNVSAFTLHVRVLHASHRFDAALLAARELLTLSPGRSEPFELLGDALLEAGRLEDAAAAFAGAQRIDGMSIDVHVRLARLAVARGLRPDALRHLRAALRGAQALSLPSPALVAWCHVQLGRYWFAAGRLAEAEAESGAAAGVHPDSLLVRDQLAELAAAKGDYAVAIAGYRALIAASPRPEFRQALGDVYLFANDPAAARAWHDRAEAGYLASVRAGHVHYYHHLAGFYSDSRPNGTAAISFAARDLAFRRSIAAQDALAWAYYVANRIDEAAAVTATLPLANVADAHVLYHAGMIASRRGDVAGGARLLQRALRQNPRYNGFHVHR